MSVVLAATAAALFAIGTYLVLQRTLTRIIIGLGLLSHGANVLLMAGRPPRHSRRSSGRATPADFSDPLPQALALTAIVITLRRDAPSCSPWPTGAGCSPTTTRSRTTSRTGASGATAIADEEVADEPRTDRHDRAVRTAVR